LTRLSFTNTLPYRAMMIHWQWGASQQTVSIQNFTNMADRTDKLDVLNALFS